MAACTSCGAALTWAVNDSTGKRAPLDYLPNSAGNIVIVATLHDGTPQYHVLNKDDREHERYAELQHYTSHFQTCPRALEHRR